MSATCLNILFEHLSTTNFLPSNLADGLIVKQRPSQFRKKTSPVFSYSSLVTRGLIH
jgi:hypothetical protein